MRAFVHSPKCRQNLVHRYLLHRSSSDPRPERSYTSRSCAVFLGPAKATYSLFADNSRIGSLLVAPVWWRNTWFSTRMHSSTVVDDQNNLKVGSVVNCVDQCKAALWKGTESIKVPREPLEYSETAGNGFHNKEKRSRPNMFEDSNNDPMFRPRNVIVLTKLTRYEFEKRLHPNKSEQELELLLKQRGTDYARLVEKHNVHQEYVNLIERELKRHGIEARIVQRWEYTKQNIDWADAVITAGGDGTFLLASSKIRDCQKPVIGINTDPESEGYMCLMKKLPANTFKGALENLLAGKFRWLWRQRIRVTLSGNNAFDDPIELHDQQLMYPEYRWSEHIHEHEETRLRSHSRVMRSSSITSPTDDGGQNERQNILPVLALNEVFIGESLSSRVSYYMLQVDEGERVKQKSSGLTVCTGTGSTSWYFNINKLTEVNLAEMMRIMNDEFKISLPADDTEVLSNIAKRFNSELIYSPDDPRMAYAVRDPVFNNTFPLFPSRGFCKSVNIQSRCYDAHLVIDGGLSYIFNDGAKAKLEIHPEDALRTVIFRD